MKILISLIIGFLLYPCVLETYDYFWFKNYYQCETKMLKTYGTMSGHLQDAFACVKNESNIIKTLDIILYRPGLATINDRK